ncbi:MAG: TlpA family protein disulfide reductase [Desulfobacterales bacterium]|nr:TlpA family protein disulfide reductase [Bacteroidia bacterium]NNK87799.1 TlpA family protein disulfide reductase [Flavobacteriaceae bacterium]NNL75420.1 TlpA family protein disulfide reductase [Desulfobacterales bacterium]
MKVRILVLVLIFTVFDCSMERPTIFSENALNDELLTVDDRTIRLAEVLNENKGKVIFLDIWATWCRDCMVGFPEIRALQKEFPAVDFIFLSVDKNPAAWRKGVQKYNMQGQHYFIKSGWDGPIGEFVRLNWIPRYMIIDEQGLIKLFKATKAGDKKIKAALL